MKDRSGGPLPPELEAISDKIHGFIKRLSDCFVHKVEVTVLVRDLEDKHMSLVFTRDDLNKVILIIDELRRSQDH